MAAFDNKRQLPSHQQNDAKQLPRALGETLLKSLLSQSTWLGYRDSNPN